jgi:uncharacterized protein
MVKLQEIRSFMREQAVRDRRRKSIQITAPTIEEALKEASVELELPVKRLAYEVLEKGSTGFAGLNRRNYLVVVYEADQEDAEVDSEDFGIDFDAIGTEEAVELESDGEVIVRLSANGVLLKVTSPSGGGRRVNERMAVEALERRGITNIDRSLVGSVVREAGGEYVRVGEFSYNPANDSVMSVNITDHEMKASVVVQAPGPGGIDQTYESMLGFLKSNRVIHGIDHETLREFEDHPRYATEVVVARGEPTRDGKDAKIVYTFDTARSKIKLKEKNGRVDFREMNLVQNVVEGQVLAKKVSAEEGVPGRTVTGKLLPAKSGRDVVIDPGKNVEVSDDGLVAKATINGQVIIANDKINVEPIYVVAGDVNLKTGGNVIFLGTVLVKGNVDEGFKVKASGNVEVLGNVGKAEIDSEGDVIVHQGITAKTGGSIRAGKSVWAKFIENAKVDAGEFVVASDGIINSDVISNKKIVCQGKRATIVGGNLKATEEIHAKTLGSVAGSETVLEVGYDPKSKERLAGLEGQVREIDGRLEEISLNINTLENLKRIKKELPEDKAGYFSELVKKRDELTTSKLALLDDVKKIQQHLSSLKVRGRVSASARVYPGVRIFIKDAYLEVRNEFRAVTFINDANLVKVTKYEEMDEDLVRRK